jgi:hydroxymethylpyrimidine/phosphomethylpyrimidine kinase
VASAVLAYMSINPDIRSAMNVKFDQKILSICKSKFNISSYDRADEAANIKRTEGKTVYWGIRCALTKNPEADVIYHTGDVGKEPMTMIFGSEPCEVLSKVKTILKLYNC